MELIKKYKDADDVAFVAIQTVFEGFDANTPEKAWACGKKYGLKIPIGHDGENGVRSKIMQGYQTRGTPWSIVIDRAGVVRANNFHFEFEEACTLIDALRQEKKEGGASAK